jgi:CRISPR/Cas system-associated exonuclease Cas4 (RecB family)
MTMSLPPLVPARILNEHVYCPRLAYLEWVDQRFEDNADTAHGTFVHRRVHDERGTPPEPDSDERRPASTGINLSSEELGLIAKVDLLEPRDATVVPIEYKRGRPRSDDEPLWEPELVQLCAQVLLLGGGVPRRACGGVLRRDQDPPPHPDRRRARRSDALRPRRAPRQRRS